MRFFSKKNKSKYLYAAISILIVAILSNFYLNNTEKRKNESNSSMGQALLALSRGDLQNAKIQFETIISDYSGSDIAHLSNYYVGKIEFENKNYTISDEYIRKYLLKITPHYPFIRIIIKTRCILMTICFYSIYKKCVIIK